MTASVSMIFFFLNRWETKTLSMGIKALNTRIEELCFTLLFDHFLEDGVLFTLKSFRDWLLSRPYWLDGYIFTPSQGLVPYHLFLPSQMSNSPPLSTTVHSRQTSQIVFQDHGCHLYTEHKQQLLFQIACVSSCPPGIRRGKEQGDDTGNLL